MAAKRGYFITFEGAEGSGKSTQVKLLCEYLAKKKIDYEVSREPGGTDIGEQIREILLNPKNSKMCAVTELLLYSASRSQHIYERIKPAIESGKIFISDRFSFATLAYQGYGRKIDLELIKKITDIAVQGIEPDLIFLLDIDPLVGVNKAKIKSQAIYATENGDRLENESIEFHNDVRNGYLELACQNHNVKVIEYAPIEIVHQQIIKTLEQKFGI
ncbi:MAG TPA: dTMP kinase [bacterium]|nr:dTMP kinase [bacterium]HPP88280.1 dTMP kinase [bacterium]